MTRLSPAGGGFSALLLCDNPLSASRACTKMHLTANGQSSRCILLDYMCKFLVSGMGRVRKVSAVLPVVLPPSGRFF